MLLFVSDKSTFQYLCNLTGCGPGFPDPVSEKTGRTSVCRAETLTVQDSKDEIR